MWTTFSLSRRNDKLLVALMNSARYPQSNRNPWKDTLPKPAFVSNPTTIRNGSIGAASSSNVPVAKILWWVRTKWFPMFGSQKRAHANGAIDDVCVHSSLELLPMFSICSWFANPQGPTPHLQSDGADAFECWLVQLMWTSAFFIRLVDAERWTTRLFVLLSLTDF